MGFPRSAIVAALFALLGAALWPAPADAVEFTADQRKEIESIIHEYLLKNPQVFLDALQAAEDKLSSESSKKTAETLAAHQREVFDDPQAPVGGNPKGDITMVEFFDYHCPYCKQVEPALEGLLADDHKLRFVYKEYPVLGPDSVTAARAALASRQQGKYQAFHRALMALKGSLDTAAIDKAALSVGLDVDRLKHDMAAPEVERDIKANLDLGDVMAIHGTPTFIVGDQVMPGAADLATLKQMIADARKSRG